MRSRKTVSSPLLAFAQRKSSSILSIKERPYMDALFLFVPTLLVRLGEMLCDELGHLEHVDHLLAPEDFLQGVIGVDVALVLCILKIVLLDVDPQALHYLTTRHRTLSNDLSQVCADRHRLHKCGIRFCHRFLMTAKYPQYGGVPSRAQGPVCASASERYGMVESDTAH